MLTLMKSGSRGKVQWDKEYKLSVVTGETKQDLFRQITLCVHYLGLGR